MLSKRIKFRVVIVFGIIYFVSFWLLTIGYFTPYWVLIHLVDGKYDNEWSRTNYPFNVAPWNSYLNEKCYSIGVVTRSCDSKTFDWFKENNIDYTSTVLGNSFKLMTAAIVVVYTNASLLVTAVVFDLFQNSLYMSFLSISFGIFYPTAAILILVATIYVENAYRQDTGYSAMLCTIAGCLMLIFYAAIITYDIHYIKRSYTKSSKIQNPKQALESNEFRRHHASQHDQSLQETKLKNIEVNPVREWGLRRV
ncbi:uncharacterized protein LOC132740191 [Ruditapes philippinarum]|uniref:uncharacterized protein LOC132740191 n=1 Tax=Ruditapes philippinarum TaxID=129788 RepID=UPI00295AED04|nr:uncharacterized protein LOC132740191 [Ruditapes philippinarum]